ncbi:hypothetical protein U0070_027567, partial [Myodes glareolus]
DLLNPGPNLCLHQPDQGLRTWCGAYTISLSRRGGLMVLFACSLAQDVTLVPTCYLVKMYNKHLKCRNDPLVKIERKDANVWL